MYGHSYPIDTAHHQWYGNICQYKTTYKTGTLSSLESETYFQDNLIQDQNFLAPVVTYQNVQTCGMFLQDEPQNVECLSQHHQINDSSIQHVNSERSVSKSKKYIRKDQICSKKIRKPSYSYVALIWMAINNSPTKQASLREIIIYITEK